MGDTAGRAYVRGALFAIHPARSVARSGSDIVRSALFETIDVPVPQIPTSGVESDQPVVSGTGFGGSVVCVQSESPDESTRHLRMTQATDDDVLGIHVTSLRIRDCAVMLPNAYS